MLAFKQSPLVACLVILGLLLAACQSAAPAPSSAPAPAPTQAAAPKPAATEAPKAAAQPTAAPAQPTAAAKAAAKTAPVSLRIAIPADEGILQPYAYITGYPGWNMLSLLYDALYVFDADNLPKPWLAKEAKASADGKTWTITLRDGVKWHDGQAFSSADVKFAYEYYKANTHSRWTGPVRNFTSIETPNASTVVITLPTPDPQFAFRVLADLPIIPKHLWEGKTDPKTFNTNVGTGAYKLAEHQTDQFYRFTANPDFFAGKPAVDELVIPIIKDPNTIFSALKTGEIHSTIRILSPELVKDFQSNAELKVQRGPGFATTLLQFNDERAPWDKTAVRQAVALAIDTQKLVDTVLLGFATAGNPGWLHPASPFHDPAVKGEYSVEKAKALLDGLGYKDSNGDGVREADGKPMEAALLVQSNQPLRIRAAELIAAGLKDIGINVKVTAMESNSLDAKVWPDFDVSKGRDFDLAMFGWSAPVQANPLRMVSLVHSKPAVGSLNIGGFKNAEVDKVADEINITVDEAKQKTLMRQLEALTAKELPFLMLYYDDGIYAYRPAAYDRWVYQKGQGIFHKLSFMPDAKP